MTSSPDDKDGAVPTPRVDAEAFVRNSGETYKQFQHGEYVRAGFARQLEQELHWCAVRIAELSSARSSSVPTPDEKHKLCPDEDKHCLHGEDGLCPQLNETCAYCGENYPKPIAHHHSAEECRANDASMMTEGIVIKALRPVVSEIFNKFGSLSRGQALQMLTDAMLSTRSARQEKTFELIDAVVAFVEKHPQATNLEGWDRLSLAVHDHPLSHVNVDARSRYVPGGNDG